jgi:predicted MFS family arabinose efflux permease
LTGDIVPIGWRGRYFASRNMVMGIGGMGVILAAGYLLNQMPGLAGYQVVLGLAFGLGMISTLFFTRLSETVQSPATPQAFGLVELIRTVVRNRGFLVFTLAAGVWNFSLNISVPFFSVFMAKGLLLDAGTIGALGIFANLAALPAQRWMGPLVDRFGPRRMQMITGFLIPALPFAWVFITEAWQIALLNVFSGALWAGFSLASFNMLLTMAPSDQMARYTALYQMVIAIALAAGAAFGSLVISYWSYAGVFILSAVGRLIGAILFSWLVPGDKSESVAASG